MQPGTSETGRKPFSVAQPLRVGETGAPKSQPRLRGSRVWTFFWRQCRPPSGKALPFRGPRSGHLSVDESARVNATVRVVDLYTQRPRNTSPVTIVGHGNALYTPFSHTLFIPGRGAKRQPASTL